MSQSRESKNKALVLKAFDTLFNQRDYAAAERFWSPDYIQHTHIEPGREGLFNLIRGAPSTLKYEPGVIVAEGDFVIIHGRFSGNGALGAGLPQTFCALPTMSWLSTGMSCRTRQLARSQRVACLCLVIALRIDHGITRTTAIEDEEAHSPAWFHRSAWVMS